MRRPVPILACSILFLSFGCGGSAEENTQGPAQEVTAPEASSPEAAEGESHEHAEESLGSVTIGDLQVELAQGHGGIAPGQEGHLVVKLPYNDGGSTIVRAWIGTQDRTLSFVGKGEYAPSHDDYDVHAVAPDPLTGNPQWWIEIEKPDGTRLLGSARPLLD